MVSKWTLEVFNITSLKGWEYSKEKYGNNIATKVKVVPPKIDIFRDVCSRYDPNGVFRNSFVEDKLSL